MKIENQKSKIENLAAFTLIELLVVISIIGVLAAMTLPVVTAIKRQQHLKVARGELAVIEAALDNYKAKYGVYPPGNRLGNPLLNQLYYELSGTTANGANAVTLDGRSSILTAAINTAYGVGGFVNFSKGGDEDAAKAKNFLPSLSDRQYNEYVTNNLIRTTALVTSVGGPDDGYRPLLASGLNPFRYANPGTNNPGSYDLWVQLVIKGKTNLICNWSRQTVVNSPLP
jgi:prepilin-type N-terminal cleavage/methylation domain-containing protein